MEGCDRSCHWEKADNERRINAWPTINTLLQDVRGDHSSADH